MLAEGERHRCKYTNQEESRLDASRLHGLGRTNGVCRSNTATNDERAEWTLKGKEMKRRDGKVQIRDRRATQNKTKQNQSRSEARGGTRRRGPAGVGPCMHSTHALN